MEDKEKEHEKKRVSDEEMTENLFIDHEETQKNIISGQEVEEQGSSHKNIEEHVDSKGKMIMTDEQYESFQSSNRFQEEKKKFIEILSSGDKCTTSPLELEIPIQPSPSDPSKMMLLKVSNIFGIQSKAFDAETYVEEDENMAVDDDATPKKHFHLPNNIIRWKEIKNADGTTNRESNARFIRWSDGSFQLQIGEEAFEVTKQDIQNEHNHLFLRHDEQGILEAKGKLYNKLIIMPSSLSSSSHNSLTAHIDSQQQRSPKVKSCPTEIDPEWVMKDAKKVEEKKVQEVEENSRKKKKKKKKKKKFKATTSKEEKNEEGPNTT